MLVRTLILLLALGGSALVVGQAPATTADNLATGISQVRAGEFFTALFTLNQVVRQPTGDPVRLARAHAFRAMAYAGLNQLDRARAEVALSLAADPAIIVDTPDYSPITAGLFAEERRPLPQNPEAAGMALEQTGRLQQAFVAYLEAYQSLANPVPPAADDQRLREKMIGLAARLEPAPPVPSEARAHLKRAQDLLDAEAILGGAAGVASQQAVAALHEAIRLAPWWPDATFQLATVLQRLDRGEEALLNLNLYRLADPDGFAAKAGRAGRTPTEPSASAPAPATIYVYWPEQQRGGGRQKLQCNGQPVAELQNNRFVTLRAAPGSHDLAFRNKHVTVVAEAGRQYFLRASIEGHWQFAMGPEIRLTESGIAQEEMRRQEMKANDARRTFAIECTARR
jgi:tetratricopeptide (TPR) repeat protein